MTNWQFIPSPPGWWAFYYKDKKKIAMPIVAWRMMVDNRDPEDIEASPGHECPYGEPMIHAGDGLLESAFGQGNPFKSGDGHTCYYDFRDGWTFDHADFIPKPKGILKRPEGDCIYWEVL